MDLLPKVFRTEGDLTDFNSSRIYESIIKETGLSEDKAKKITELVVRRIISSGIKFLSGPHIREIVCSILSEQHFEDERKLYTRIGMPLMDYEEIIEKGSEKFSKTMNPEIIHHWASNRISEEYTHLRILTNEESKAHLYGDIHINKLRYFDLRPMTQTWDPSMILENGLPPLKGYISCCSLKPAKNLKEACDHLIKWLILAQNEISGIQGYLNVNNYLAPYVINLNEQNLKLIIKNFIYDMNYFSAISGRTISPTSLITIPSIASQIAKIPSIGPFGILNGHYEDFHGPSLSLFDNFTRNFIEGDDNNLSFLTPKHDVFISEHLLNRYYREYQNILSEISSMRTPFLIKLNNQKFQDNDSKNIQPFTYNSQGILQEVCLNLPRVAYLSKDESDFMEILKEKIELSSQILVKKYDIIKRRLKANHLPLLNGIINSHQIYNLENQCLSLSFIGLNEAIKYLTTFELHENSDAFNLGKRILIEMSKTCNILSKKEGISFIVSENTSDQSSLRFAKLDRKHFSKVAIPQKNGKLFHYTDSAHFRDKVDIDLIDRVKKQEVYHQYIDYNAIEYISLENLYSHDIKLEDFIKKIFMPSKLERVKFY
ncbi:MAG: anaerobic ribonucleoside-triphosphate reductase [Candidatus Thorarchaeota archaeon]